MLSFIELEVGLRMITMLYIGRIKGWEFRKEGSDYYMLVIPEDPMLLADPYAYRQVDKLLDYICVAYEKEIRWAQYEVSITNEITELPYFCFKLEGCSV